ncbi:hypothetical protein [Algoriphagus machipongonensis]|uniref:Collagen-like protein n=1 Tax=Algoriphagus machipongonensis TaxID=388413 RepID=A3HYD1_9BACT|nr:hypothetical protein [Algoriphagus machipongonensis]EAZ80267.2 hypothetical protein ALPR1_05075 [Algoriphagus machipongonensis]
MRKITAILGLIGIISFQACEGPVGPQGPPGLDGFDGQDGVNIVSEVFEVEVDFNDGNGYQEIFTFDPAIVESDVVLAFIQWENDGGTPIWRALPQTVFFEEGVLMYNYDFTSGDFSVFLDGPLDYSLLTSDWTDNQLFRVVVVPGDFSGARIDWTDYEAVTKHLGLTDEDFTKIELKK